MSTSPGKDGQDSHDQRDKNVEYLDEWSDEYTFREAGKVGDRHLYKASGGVTETDIRHLENYFETDPRSDALVEAQTRLPEEPGSGSREGRRRTNHVDLKIHGGRNGVKVISDRPILDILNGQEETETEFHLLEGPGSLGSPKT